MFVVSKWEDLLVISDFHTTNPHTNSWSHDLSNLSFDHLSTSSSQTHQQQNKPKQKYNKNKTQQPTNLATC